MSIKVNFKIESYNSGRGTLQVKYWADGVDERLYNIGPFDMAIGEELTLLDPTDDEGLLIEIARYGRSIISDQLRVDKINATPIGAKVDSWQGQDITVQLATDPDDPDDIDEVVKNPIA